MKASASNPIGNCVDLTRVDDMIIMRNTRDPDGPVLTFTRDEIAAFFDGVMRREFHHLIEGPLPPAEPVRWYTWHDHGEHGDHPRAIHSTVSPHMGSREYPDVTSHEGVETFETATEARGIVT